MNIGMLHTSLGGAEGHDPYAPCSVADLATAGFDYWALGHVHRRFVHHEAPFIVMPGMPQGRDMGEDGPKSVTLIHVAEDGLVIEERSTAAVEFRRTNCDVSDCAEMADLHDRIAAQMRGFGGEPSVVARLTLVGTSTLNWQLRRDADLVHAVASEAAEAVGSVWIDRIEIATAPPIVETPTDTAADEIAGLIAEAAQAPSLLEEAKVLLLEMLADLPPELRDHWADDHAALESTAGRLIVEATDWAIARMHGNGDC